MKFTYILSILSVFMFTACNNSPDSVREKVEEKSVEEIKAGDRVKNSDLVLNPVEADEPTDSINVAKLEFETELYEFGTVKEGDVVKYVFDFKNVGKVPLVISGARSTCGCTVPEFPKEPIAVGESSKISVKFNTKNKKGNQRKPIIITANTYPKETRVHIEGVVKSKDGAKAEN